jgi:hypothetical protein
MCRALKVLCVAAALRQLDEEHPHVVAVVGAFDAFVAETRRRVPYIRIVTDRDVAAASAVVSDLSEMRDAIKGLPRPGGPITGAPSA